MKRILLGILFVLFGRSGLMAATQTGLDGLVEGHFAPLWGKRVGVLVNDTSRDREGRHVVDMLLEAPGVTLAAVFTPEHGFSAKVEHGRPVADDVVPGTKIPLYSLYGKTQRPTPAMLRGLDALVCDLPDVGTRFYTYITTLGYAMEEAAKANLEFIVLDRPNPLGGDVVEGVVLSTTVRHFTAYYSVPTRHGLTVGEIARLHNETTGLNARLLVLPMKGWKRRMGWDETGLPFLPPSPNIRTPRAALLYAGLGAFESTNVSVGRGTPTPFEVFGAPWMKNRGVARRLMKMKFPGLRLTETTFTPKTDRYKGKKCYGVRVAVTDFGRARPVDLFVHAVAALRERAPAEFNPRWAEMPRVVGSAEFEEWYKSNGSVDLQLQRMHKSAAAFRTEREPFLLYP